MFRSIALCRVCRHRKTTSLEHANSALSSSIRHPHTRHSHAVSQTPAEREHGSLNILSNSYHYMRWCNPWIVRRAACSLDLGSESPPPLQTLTCKPQSKPLAVLCAVTSQGSPMLRKPRKESKSLSSQSPIPSLWAASLCKHSSRGASTPGCCCLLSRGQRHDGHHRHVSSLVWCCERSRGTDSRQCSPDEGRPAGDAPTTKKQCPKRCPVPSPSLRDGSQGDNSARWAHGTHTRLPCGIGRAKPPRA